MMKKWERITTARIGYFGECKVLGTPYRSDVEDAWHLTAWPRSKPGDPSEYWLAGDAFHGCGMKITGDPGVIFEIDAEAALDLDPEVRMAMLAARAAWELSPRFA